ncbi:hypothetical protein HZI73_11680 [Vallitalea pronyensis]|uniref:Uncharacterized protein n=1 Tax=Vallitalea pronyensis TaxID=1348613 RepID=A0A8J8MJD4_9FIRM|nr:hypothetical protein [Vallitalea pronyensis]QUI22907.1 hypothetical protein HZI73_11680 [Vallitalea pronyensis]
MKKKCYWMCIMVLMIAMSLAGCKGQSVGRDVYMKGAFLDGQRPQERFSNNNGKHYPIMQEDL